MPGSSPTLSAPGARFGVVDWLIEPFELGFQQRALVGGSLAAIALALIGTWVVIRGMSFLGDALVHGVVPGIALAVLFDFNPVVGAGVAALAMMAGINVVHRQTDFPEDTGIGLLFVGMLGLGVILISRTPSYAGDLTSILFGDVLAVTSGDIVWLAALGGTILLATTLLYRPLLVLSFNEQKASLLGLRPRVAHAALLVLIAIVIIGSYQTVGTMLVFGLLIGPPATAALVARRVPSIMATSVVIGLLSVWAGLMISYHANTSGSATMAVVPIAIFFVVLAFRSVGTQRKGGATA